MAANEITDHAERLYLFVQHFGRRLRDIDLAADLSPARFSVLTSLAFHGKANVSELAAFERVRRPSMTRLIRDMERAGLVLRAADPSDGRGVLVELTARGHKLVKMVRAKKIEMIERHIVRQDRAAINTLGPLLSSLEHLANDGNSAEDSRHHHSDSDRKSIAQRPRSTS